MRKVGVVLGGCGVQDGSEIHEAVSVLLALARKGAQAVCLAPSGPQTRVMNHAAGTPMDESRDMLVEAARIARGEISTLAEAKVRELDGVVIPGGFGAALNLSNFATAGADMQIHTDLQSLLSRAYRAGKPLCALCIAPPILAKLMQQEGVQGAKLTIGNDTGTAAAIEALGQTHVAATATQAVVDHDHKLVTGPAYMLASNVAELYKGIDKAIDELLKLT